MSQNKQDTILIFIFKVIMKIKLLKMAKTNISRPKQWNLLPTLFPSPIFTHFRPI